MARLSVGDEVTFQLGAHRQRARVVEDRGNLGVEGRRVFRLALIGSDPDDAVEFELSEELLEIAAERVRRGG
jgi:hypothetical protein